MKLVYKKFIFVIFLLISSTCAVSAFALSIEILDKYTNVLAGDSVYFKMNVEYPENLEQKDLTLEYKMFDEQGNLIARIDSLRDIEAQLSVFNSMVIPRGSKPGLYTITIEIKDGENSIGKASASFNVVNEEVNWSIVVLGVAFLLSIIYFGFLLRDFWRRLLIGFKVRRIVRGRFEEKKD
ncbi:hypothetical protein J4226_05050 [Candidatus Pacearchaeota archaeon]|nr:hypothetical protein [Candidatus Pacearchaeota archaeon]